MGNIKWSALAVSQAMDKVEKQLEPIFAPLDEAYATVKEAYLIPNLPQYMSQHLTGLAGEISRIQKKPDREYGSAMGTILAAVARVRDELPKDALEAEKKSDQYGRTPSLIG